MTQYIKNCPHCGGNAVLKENYNANYGFFICVKCTICGAQGKTVNTKIDDTEAKTNAITAWNMRYEENAGDYITFKEITK